MPIPMNTRVTYVNYFSNGKKLKHLNRVERHLLFNESPPCLIEPSQAYTALMASIALGLPTRCSA